MNRLVRRLAAGAAGAAVLVVTRARVAHTPSSRRLNDPERSDGVPPR